MDEQLFWAVTLEQLGLAAKPLLAKDATETQLASRISTILSNDSYLKNANKIGAIISERHGISNAVDLIEKNMT